MVLIHIKSRGHVMQVHEFLFSGFLLLFCLWRASRVEGFALAEMDSMYATLMAIPSAVQNTITPALDRLIDGIQSPPLGEVMTPQLYTGDEYVTSNGTPDAEKFASMVKEYQSIDTMLTSMKQYNNGVFQKITSIG